jgi:Winged helix DNA-binding domain
VLRPTWHFVTPADLRWMLALTAPRVNALRAHNDRLYGLDRPTFARSRAAIAKALEGGGHRTRDELGDVLTARVRETRARPAPSNSLPVLDG